MRPTLPVGNELDTPGRGLAKLRCYLRQADRRRGRQTGTHRLGRVPPSRAAGPSGTSARPEAGGRF